jgi:hypothetical protein
MVLKSHSHNLEHSRTIARKHTVNLPLINLNMARQHNHICNNRNTAHNQVTNSHTNKREEPLWVEWAPSRMEPKRATSNRINKQEEPLWVE